jgi:uncharacterized protein (TIGR03435 family)
MLARLICIVATGVAVWGQSAPSALPEFEAASVKVASPTDRRSPPRGGPGTSTPGQFTGTGLTLQTLIFKAWNLKQYQLTGPASLNTEQYDIALKIPPGTTAENFNLMLQRLLTERLGLVVHRESKEMPVYDLVVAKGGLKMQAAAATAEAGTPADPDAPSPGGQAPAIQLVKDKDGKSQLPAGRKMAIVMGGAGGVSRQMARMQEMSDIARYFEGRAGRPVIDKTGSLDSTTTCSNSCATVRRWRAGD